MRTLVVSAYYKIPSKASHAVYTDYLRRFFRSIRCSVLFFTSADLVDELRSMTPPSSPVRFCVVERADWVAWNKGRAFWDRQKARDVEAYHTPELAAVWYEKKEFVSRAMEMPDYAAFDVFIWCDAGCVRDDSSEEALCSFGLRNAPLHDGKLHVQQIKTPALKAFYSFPDVRIAGAILAGNRAAWSLVRYLYEVALEDYDAAGVSGNSDQYVLARCIDQSPSQFSCWPNCTSLDRWFFFLGVL